MLWIYSRFCANMTLHYIIASLERICINQLIFCNLRFPIHFGGYLKGVLIKTQLKMNWNVIKFFSRFPSFPFSYLENVGICLDAYWLLIQEFLSCLKWSHYMRSMEIKFYNDIFGKLFKGRIVKCNEFKPQDILPEIKIRLQIMNRIAFQ